MSILTNYRVYGALAVALAGTAASSYLYTKADQNKQVAEKIYKDIPKTKDDLCVDVCETLNIENQEACKKMVDQGHDYFTESKKKNLTFENAYDAAPLNIKNIQFK
ncbi:thrB [Acrasis kona]|uniref:ThrB n=1 Tax=Acrasis kona TaxID=1008807 RepID=A0AAW2Z6H7_9EUKA